MKNEKFKSFDGTIIQCYIWDDVRSPKGVVQIAHGMAEHSRRYDNFANFLNKNGYIVFADDHRAHGQTSTKQSVKGVKGYHKGDIFGDTVKDEIAITAYLLEKFGRPVFLVGHSYGSFIAQSYLESDQKSSGVVMTGTANMNNVLGKLGAGIASMQYKMVGGEKKGKLLDKMSFGSYNAPFKKEKLAFAWLSRDREQVKKYMLDEQCGYVMSVAFFKFFLCGLKNTYKTEYLAKINKEAKIAIFCGSDDPVGGKGKLAKKLLEQYLGLGMKNVSLKFYEGARHEVLNEINNKEVYADILAAINGMIIAV